MAGTIRASVDTVIVGAGPAGAAAAIYLARQGDDVLLVDKASFPRDKCCGDGLTTLALRELEQLDFDPGKVDSFTPIDAAVVVGPNDRTVRLPLPERGMYAAVARREELDAALVDQAVQAGAATAFGHKVTAVRPSNDNVTVELANGEQIEAKQLIAADGAWSPVRKMLGLQLDGYRGEWHAFRQYFTNVADAAANDLWVWFEPDLLPGYVWSFPVGPGVANVGFGIRRGGDISIQSMKALWPDILARPRIAAVLGTDAVSEDRHLAWPIPANVGNLALTGPRTLFVGDAAATCDPLTGEGIGQALMTGRLAAESILSTPNEFSATSKRYEHEARRDLVADHKSGVVLSKLLSSERVTNYSLRAVDLNDWTRRNFGRWMFEDYPRALLGTPRRWGRGALSEPGAWAETSVGQPN